MLWGAGLACALGGAVAGNALGSTPPLDRSTIAMMYQSHETALPDQVERAPLPDHYPLVTRSGIIPVAELATRGLYSQARYRAYLQAADYALYQPSTDEYRYDGEQAGYTIEDASVRTADAEVAARPASHEAEPATPLQLAAGPVAVEGRAKLIDVGATLAMR